MVNQNQILAMLRNPDIQLFHRDLPFFLAHWDAKRFPAGFSPEQAAAIDALTGPPPGQPIDCLFRIASPARTSFDPAQKTLTFLVTEIGLAEANFDAPLVDRGLFTRNANRIVTPSRWARERLVDYGFDAGAISVVPHGVDSNVFFPMSAEQRQAARAAIGIEAGETVYVNVGVATWNKGLDLLILAFAQLRRHHPRARLLLKDHKGLYGIGVEQVIANLRSSAPDLVDERTLAAISVLSGSLDLEQLRSLYGLADAYVSAYRAEGFNLPVLEAMACGTPVIVTAGGATDDFCPDVLCTKVPARPRTPDDMPSVAGHFLIPDLDGLIEAMLRVAQGGVPRDDPARLRERERLMERLSWTAVTRQLLDLM